MQLDVSSEERNGWKQFDRCSSSGKRGCSKKRPQFGRVVRGSINPGQVAWGCPERKSQTHWMFTAVCMLQDKLDKRRGDTFRIFRRSTVLPAASDDRDGRRRFRVSCRRL